MFLEVLLAVAAGVGIAVVLFAVSMFGAAKWRDDAIDTVLAGAAREAGIASSSPRSERALRTLGLDEAAALLGIDPYTLVAWEARYGFPTSSPSEALYSESEVLALRDALRDGASVASAVAQARTRARRRRTTASAQLGDRRGGGVAS
jgi:hypothetical protein